jgi:hypothetical protein
VEWDPDTYASRRRAVRGIPLVWAMPAQRERVLVGAATLTSAQPSGTSICGDVGASVSRLPCDSPHVEIPILALWRSGGNAIGISFVTETRTRATSRSTFGLSR